MHRWNANFIITIRIFSKISIFQEYFGFSACSCDTENVSVVNESVTLILV